MCIIYIYVLNYPVLLYSDLISGGVVRNVYIHTVNYMYI